MPYFKKNGLEVSQGNSKIGADTLIFNMGSANSCPSKARGFCKLGAKCYARKPESIYPDCLPYRDRQEIYWLNHSAKEIANALSDIILKRNLKKRVISYVRFNESGDFWSQECVNKLARVAAYVRAETGVFIYGYTARKDLNFGDIVSFSVKGSGHTAGNNGEAIARPKKDLADLAHKGTYEEKGKKYTVCLADCSACNYCKKQDGRNIVFPIH
jgi:hypothetical protein